MNYKDWYNSGCSCMGRPPCSWCLNTTYFNCSTCGKNYPSYTYYHNTDEEIDSYAYNIPSIVPEDHFGVARCSSCDTENCDFLREVLAKYLRFINPIPILKGQKTNG